MNNEQQKIIDEAYKNYEKNAVVGDVIDSHYEPATDKWNLYNKEEFIFFIKKGDRFAKKWGLKIEEQELSRKERGDYYYKYGNSEGIVEGSLDRPIWENDETAHKWYDERNIPTKLITITRELNRDERIELYNKEYGILGNKYEPPFDDFIDAKLTTRNIPINKTIESYE